MQDQLNVQDSPQQDCSLLQLSMESQLEICRFAFHHDLDAIRSTPTSYNSAPRPLRGALALLHTCRALRTEGIDAMEPLAQASKSAIQSEVDPIELELIAVDANSYLSLFGEQESRYTGLVKVLVRLGSNMRRVAEVCSVLANARDADKKKTSG